jgi:hypothetical protein
LLATAKGVVLGVRLNCTKLISNALVLLSLLSKVILKLISALLSFFKFAILFLTLLLVAP